MAKVREATQESRFQSRDHRAHAALTFIERLEVALDRFAEARKIGSGHRSAHGHEHVRAGLHEGSLVHSDKDFAA
jgi:plasmid stabilization system protein ParE